MSLSVPCPKCSKKLKLPGREALGKIAKCPACEHRFKLALPKKSEPNSGKKKQPSKANPKVAAAAPPAPEPELVGAPMGLEARYVVDHSVAEPQLTTPPGIPQPPETEQSLPAFNFDGHDDGPAFTPPDDDVDSASPIDSDDSTSEPSTPSDPVAAFRAKRAAKRKKMTIVGVSAAAVFGVIASAAVMMAPLSPPQQPANPATTAVVQSTKRPSLKIESPTRGDAIPTNLLPAGVGMLVHLRPAEIWSPGPASDIVVSLPPSLKPWTEGMVRRYALREPSEINELTIGYILGARGVEPKIATVVRTVEPKPLGDFLQEFPGQTERYGEMRLIKLADKAIFVKDETTFAVAPPELADELADAAEGRNAYIAAAIDQIVDQTDRDRLVNIVIGVDDFEIHAPRLMPESIIDLANSVLGTLGNPQAVAWSIHPGEHVYSEFVIQPRTGTTPVAAEQKLLAAIEKAPQSLVSRLKLRNPGIEGVRNIVGRFPAMMEAARLSTDIVADSRNGVVDMRTLLPAVAGPNIALGTVMTYNVMAMAPQTQAVASQPAKPAETDNRTVAEKLLTQVEGEFIRMPLQEALGYLAEEAKIELEIDGDALKSAGYTKNMAQTFDMGQVTVKEALKQITAQYDKMAVAIDEDAGKLIVLTKQFAEQRGLTPIEF